MVGVEDGAGTAARSIPAGHVERGLDQSGVDAVAHRVPTRRRLPTSSTTAKYSQPSPVRM